MNNVMLIIIMALLAAILFFTLHDKVDKVEIRVISDSPISAPKEINPGGGFAD